MTIGSKKQNRLRLVLIACAAISCSSVTMSGTLAVLAMQHSVTAPAAVA